jgi:cell shape-determining protein MreC
MITTSLDILYVVLAAVILLVGILLAVAILYLIFILRDASKASSYIKDTAQKVNEFVYKPLLIAHSIVDKIMPIIESLKERGEEVAENVTKKKSKRGRPKKK